MNWQRIVGWQLLVFGGVWAMAVYGWGGASWTALAAVPNVVEAVMSEPALVRGAKYAAYAPAFVAAAIGAMYLLSARRPRRTLAQQLADDRAPSRRRR